MKDEMIVKLFLKENEEDFYYLYLQFSDSEACSPNCDACIDYTIMDKDGIEVDGGQMDYNSAEAGYKSIEDTLGDVVDFCYSDIFPDSELEDVGYSSTDLDLEDIVN